MRKPSICRRSKFDERIDMKVYLEVRQLNMNRRSIRRDSFKEKCREFGFEILLEVVWNIITFIPRMLFRIVKGIFDN